jgi:ubiquinone/menaquinone biosynthesis C-methylase UbiE
MQTAEKKILNVGCGRTIMEDACNVDIDPGCGADTVCDLNEMPWPFEDDSFEMIYAYHIIEHVAEPYRFIQEIHRVARKDATVEIETPHYSSPDSWNDISHKYHFGTRFLGSFVADGPGSLYALLGRDLKFGHGIPSLAGKIVARAFGVSFYEKYCCFLFPARNMRFRLRALK